MCPIKIITLSREVVRKESFMKNNRHLDYEFIEGVDWRSLALSTITNNSLFGHDLYLTANDYAMVMSHASLWDLVAEKKQAMTISEDDYIFNADFSKRSAEVLSGLGNDWELVIWSPVEESLRAVHAEIKLDGGSVQLNPVLSSCSRFVYSISPKGVAKFKAGCFPMRPFNVDHSLLKRMKANTGVFSAMRSIFSQAKVYMASPVQVLPINLIAKNSIKGSQCAV